MSKNLLISQIILFLLLSPICLAFEKINIDFHPAKDQPYFVGIPEINIDAEEFSTLVIRLKSTYSGTARIFWASNYDSQFNETKSITFTLSKSNNYKEYVLNLKSQNPYWMGFIQQLILYPEKNKEGIEIESSQAIPGNLITTLKSGWQEFMNFERPLPRTINVIFGPKINGISVNVYIYYLIAALILIYLVYFSLKVKGLKNILNNLVPKIIFTCFVFWVLLDLRILVDQLRYAKLNWEIFDNKSLEEKQALATFQNYYDFYYFLKFCQAKLPKRALYRLIVPENYVYFQEKAQYYLYPIVCALTPDQIPDYLLIYDPQKLIDKNLIPKGYLPLANYKQMGYILKRGNT